MTAAVLSMILQTLCIVQRIFQHTIESVPEISSRSIDQLPTEMKEAVVLIDDSWQTIHKYSQLSRTWQQVSRNALLSSDGSKALLEYYAAPFETTKRLYDKSAFLSYLQYHPNLAVNVILSLLNVVLKMRKDDTRLADILSEEKVMSQFTKDQKNQIYNRLDAVCTEALIFDPEKAVYLLLLGAHINHAEENAQLAERVYIRAMNVLLDTNQLHLLSCLFDQISGQNMTFYSVASKHLFNAAMQGRQDQMNALAHGFIMIDSFLDFDEFVSVQKCHNWPMWREAFQSFQTGSIAGEVLTLIWFHHLLPEFDQCLELLDHLLSFLPSNSIALNEILLTVAAFMDPVWQRIQNMPHEELQKFTRNNPRFYMSILALLLRRGEEMIHFSNKIRGFFQEAVQSLLYCESDNENVMPLLRNNTALSLACVRMAVMRSQDWHFINQVLRSHPDQSFIASALSVALLMQKKEWVDRIMLSGVDFTPFLGNGKLLTALSYYEHLDQVFRYFSPYFNDMTEENIESVGNLVLLGHGFDLYERLNQFTLFPIKIHILPEFLSQSNRITELKAFGIYDSAAFARLELKNKLVDVKLWTYLLKQPEYQTKFDVTKLLEWSYKLFHLDLINSILQGKWLGRKDDKEYVALCQIAVNLNLTVDEVLQWMKYDLPLKTKAHYAALTLFFSNNSVDTPPAVNKNVMRMVLPHFIALNQFESVQYLLNLWRNPSKDDLESFMTTAYRYRHWKIYQILKEKTLKKSTFNIFSFF